MANFLNTLRYRKKMREMTNPVLTATGGVVPEQSCKPHRSFYFWLQSREMNLHHVTIALECR